MRGLIVLWICSVTANFLGHTSHTRSNNCTDDSLTRIYVVPNTNCTSPAEFTCMNGHLSVGLPPEKQVSYGTICTSDMPSLGPGIPYALKTIYGDNDVCSGTVTYYEVIRLNRCDMFQYHRCTNGIFHIKRYEVIGCSSPAGLVTQDIPVNTCLPWVSGSFKITCHQ